MIAYLFKCHSYMPIISQKTYALFNIIYNPNVALIKDVVSPPG